MLRHRFATGFVVLALLGATGWTTGRWIDASWQQVRAFEPAFQAESLADTMGRGLAFGLLGGFRAVTADFLWVEMNSEWEAEDLPATHKLIELVTTIDPRPLYFWINGARIIAYDMPHWRYRVGGGFENIPAAVRARIDHEQAWSAIALLERGLVTHANHPLLLLEIANIHLRRRGDLQTASEYYRLAATMPGAPFYAARIYAELLKQQGRLRDALAWLRSVHPKLPANDPTANADVVLHRIRELEQALSVPEGERYNAPGG
jgi:hypothetical protein